MGKVPVTKQAAGKKKLKNNELISMYHAKLNDTEKDEEGENLWKLGGFEAYQSASLYGTKHGDTSKWLLKMIKPLVAERAQAKLKLLDVGALAHNYSEVRWLEVDAIDLHPRVPGIKKQDFLKYDGTGFDIVCLSLVLNFAGDPNDRGAMVVKAWEVLNACGFLYVVLPRSCIDRSRFVTAEYFVKLTDHIGFECVKQHLSKKLAYFLLRKRDRQSGLPPAEPRIQANGLNNFKIRLQ